MFDNIPISFVDKHKHLDVTLSSTREWRSHIENIVTSVTKYQGIMRKLSQKKCSQPDVCVPYILPVVEYASVVCDG